MDIKIRLLITLFLLIGALIFHLLYKWITKKHKSDPVFQEEQRRKEEAYKKRVEQENQSLQRYAFSGDYSDEDSSGVSENEET